LRRPSCIIGLALSAAACGAGDTLPREALLDPAACQECHSDHYREWSGSMHAYAADDPVFRAMNARGQRETGGALGDFCVQCHAPMAVREGLTTDGLNLDAVPQAYKGVTCFFCHSVTAVEGEHNNPLRLADDGVLRGPFAQPARGARHEAAYSPLHDRGEPASSTLCGSCHDVVTPAGVHLERSFLEWRGSLFAHETQAELQTCVRCHMPGRDGLAAYVEGVPVRRVHSHAMPGVDVAVTPWPEAEAQRAAVQRELNTTLFGVLCVRRVQGGVELRVDLENFAAGHHFPSGAAHDRRAWLELRASRGGRTLYETGALADGQALVALEAEDPDLWRMGDKVKAVNGEDAHMFWDVRSVEPATLPAPTALGPWDPDYVDPHVVRTFMVPDVPDRVEMRVRVRPMGLDVLDDLIGSGDLDPALRARFPTFTLEATNVVWTPDAEDRDGDGCIPDVN
jgi:hypothetical protein